MSWKRFFLFSLLVNLLLGPTVVVLAWKSLNRKQSSRSSVTNSLVIVSSRPSENKKSRKNTPPPFHWRSLESTNYVTYIANLRAIGCPEQTIRELITAEVAKVYARRESAIPVPRFLEREYWRAESPADHAQMLKESEDYDRQLTVLNRERKALLKELLGPVEESEEEDQEQMASLGGSFDLKYLPREKRGTILKIQQEFEERAQKIHETSKGDLLPEDEEALKKLKAEERQELARVLSPQELLEHDLRHSETAENLRSQLGPFGANEKEFRAIFELRHKFDLQFGSEPSEDETPEQRKLRETALQQMDDQLKGQMGEQRFAEYKRSLDPEFPAEWQLIEQFKLPKESSVQAFDIRRAAEGEIQKVLSDPSLTEAQRDAAHQAIEKESEKELARVLGKEGYEVYQRAHDNDYQQLARLAERYGLSEDKAVRAYETRKKVIAQAEEIHSSDLPESEKVTRLKKLETETSRSLSDVLGESVFKTYQRRGGKWLEELRELAPSNEVFQFRLQSADF